MKGRIIITGPTADVAGTQTDGWNKVLIFKNFAPFINYKSVINNIEIENAKDIDTVIPMLTI